MIRIDLARCTGCRRCETACAFFRTGGISRHRSRVKVIQIYETGLDSPVLCRQCRERYCLRCPEKALTVGSLGQIVVSPTICNLCGVCETNCPVGALEIHEGIVYVCDLCGGRPACVEACTEKALEFEPGASEILSLKEHKEKSRGLNPGEKRRLFIESEGAPIRSLWEKGRG